MKKFLSFFLCLTLFFGFLPTDKAWAAAEWPANISISADGGIVIDANSGAILYGKNINVAYYPASITKILTALIIIENCDLDDTVTFSHIMFIIYLNDYSSGTNIAQTERNTK